MNKRLTKRWFYWALQVFLNLKFSDPFLKLLVSEQTQKQDKNQTRQESVEQQAPESDHSQRTFFATNDITASGRHRRSENFLFKSIQQQS